jgi:type I restriction enzyme R subunit
VTPEELARQKIDRQLIQCGWLIQNRNEMNISVTLGIAVRESTMLTGEADYLL